VWEFEIDQGDSGLERGLLERRLKGKITVPFCPESALSGIGNTDFLNAVWYRREVEIPGTWAGKRVLLHFGAVDYDATVWVNGTEVYRHRGGFTPFTCDLCGVAKAGEKVVIVVRARDDATERQPRGKQSEQHGNYGCLYTRTTGIWQTVWMEPVPMVSLGRPRITPDVANGAFHIDLPLLGANLGEGGTKGMRVKVTASDAAGVVCTAEVAADADFSPHVDLMIPADRRKLWEVGKGHLYDLAIELIDVNGKVVDQATSYAGLRSVAIDGKAVKINGKIVFQRLVLDQGFYPSGIMTAPSDEALIVDIELAIKAGFNGARLHQKVFEERFLYHADRMGYLCWGEFGDWGLVKGEDQRYHHRGGTPSFVAQWLEALQRDYSHPCIVGWCGMNESRGHVHDRITPLDDTILAMFLAAKAMDPTRPVLDVSGYAHRVQESDVWDCHNYEMDPDQLKKDMDMIKEGKVYTNDNMKAAVPTTSIAYRGQPFFNSEFGGIAWNPAEAESAASWGYGERPRTLEEFHDRFERQCAVQLENPMLFGYCYTQLTDVFQEQNGIYTFDRRSKFDMERIRMAQVRVAAIELTDPSRRENPRTHENAASGLRKLAADAHG